jgi:KUP system potassium uptake protein
LHFGISDVNAFMALDDSKKAATSYGAALAALGIVYGDIGTSPLYALKECFSGEYGAPPNFENILGVLSLVFWAITWIVVFKYLIVLMRASNDGEGGIMALIALLTPESDPKRPLRRIQLTVIFLGLFGAALLYGDGMITPAVSVLSAVEGLEISAPFFHPFVVPVTIGILFALFVAQKKGTQRVGMIFGPVMLLWFLTIAVIALPWIIRNPQVLHALNPWMALHFFIQNGIHGALVLTAVVLCVTGAEALYADMGHFGPEPIRRAWFFVVFPALILNYFGQGALLLEKGEAALANPFYALAPKVFLIPLVLLATLATVIASQALISGVFSMTQQATQLGFLPSFRVIHTSEETEGQIYIPKLNQFLLISCIALVIAFQSSAKLTGAYGIAVAGTMAITSLLFYRVSRDRWKWPIWQAAGLTSLFLFVDSALLLPNLVKIVHGGWVPILAAIFIFVLMTTWHRGQEALSRSLLQKGQPLDAFMQKIALENPHRVPGTSVCLARHKGMIPGVVLFQYRINQTLHERVVLISLSFARVPYTSHEAHGKLTEFGHGIYEIVAEYGFMERPRMDDILNCLQREAAGIDSETLNFFVGRDIILPTGHSKMARWRKGFFAFILRNSQGPTEFLKVEPELMVELGAAVKI